MKRGISFALPVAGMLLVCLMTNVNCSVIVNRSAIPMRDTVYYYNEKGKLIYRYAGNSRATFVIKTCKTKEQIYYDCKDSVTLAITADIDGITESKAQDIEQLISSGNINNSEVIENTVQILNKDLFWKIMKRIPDSGENTDSTTDFREYGGFVKRSKKFTFRRGVESDPCNHGADVKVRGRKKGRGYYHSHPSGERNNGTCAYTQGPSRGDQNHLQGAQLCYVYGMNRRSHLIYVLGSKGVKATLPFCWLLCDSVN